MNIALDDIRQDISRSVKDALKEDIGSGDITAELIPGDVQSVAHIVTREDCVVCGSAWLNEVFKQLGGLESITWHVHDGDFVNADTQLVTLVGNARTLLTGERTALNFMQTLCGTATQSRAFAKLVAGTNIKILDTRKTLPGLRSAQKYAVTIGGCHNHRHGLYDAFLIKENHIAACGGITKAVTRAKNLYPDKPIIVEVENLQEFEEASRCPVDRIMLDNFGEAEFAKTQKGMNSIPIEISGNVTESIVASLASTNVAAISTGSITKHVRAIDLSMRIMDKPAR